MSERRYIVGDCRDVLRKIDGCVARCCVTGVARSCDACRRRMRRAGLVRLQCAAATGNDFYGEGRA